MGYPIAENGSHSASDYGDKYLISLVPVERIELPTFGLQNCCFTAELNRTLLGRIGSTRSIKHDGYCLIVRRDSKRVRSFTRNGHDWSEQLLIIASLSLSHAKSSDRRISFF